MSSKTEEYLALAQRTANGLTRYWESWTDYLTTASRLYKYPFADQLMIYAQRPDATACADFDIWNNRMNRYVRRGAKGIALLDESSGFPRLHYVFDVSDTGVRRNSRDPEVWQLGPDLVQPVSEMLSKTYGISGERVSQQLADVAGKLVADYWDNNGGDIRAIVDGSLLMDYDEAGVEMQFKSAAAISVTYTLLERCGIEPAGWFDKDDFQAIYNFSTPDSVYALGAAVSDMSREVLRNIERTVKTTIRRRNAERSQYEYEQQERDLLDRRGLPAPEPNPEPAPEAAGQVRQAAPDVPDAVSPGTVQFDAPERDAVPASDGTGADSREPDAADHGAASEAGPSPGQSAEPTDVGAAHEQSESAGRGTGDDGADLQLSFLDANIPTEAQQIEKIDQAESEKTPSAFVLSQAEIENELRRHGSGFTGGKQRIIALYQTQPDRKLCAKALAKEYGIGGHSHDYLDGSRGFVNHDWKGLEFVHYPDHQKITLKWAQVEKYIDLMIQSDRYLTDEEKEQRATRQEASNYNVGDEVVVDLPTRTIEGTIGYVGETDVRIDTSAHGQSWDNEVINKQQFEQGLRQSATAQRVDKMLAQAEAIAKESEVPEYERFSVRKVVDGKMPLFAIWDDLYDDYYETNHAVPQFSNEKQAESYLENLKKEVADREAAEWLKVEHAKFLADKDEPEPSDEELDELPISAVMDGEVQTFPDAAALDEALNAAPAGNFRITDDHLGEGGAKQKYARNIEAIRTLFRLEEEHRGATAEEQQVLSQYVGWGGLADAFDPGKDSWAKEYAELKGLLSEDEYAAARSSTLNAHYTSPTVIRGIYDAVERMGFRSGNILEPSMGVGNFFGMLPDTMQDSRLYGVELDSITGRIAKKLYPQADITVAGFETTDRRDFYDLAVGNVPFGNYKVNDKAYNKLGFSIHNYFFAKAIDQIRPGGVVAFVTSRYTMDSKDSTARKHMAECADLLGAIRLPNNAFRANAGTDVVSDIIFLQKRDRPIDHEPDWVQLGKTEDGFAINQYFVDHPEMVLGNLELESTQYGHDLTVAPIEGAVLADQLAEEMKALGVSDVRVEDKCYVYGKIPATKGYEGKTKLGFIAHMDTVSDFADHAVNPIVHENYDGKDLKLADSGRTLEVSVFPHLPSLAGRTLITSDGTTVLGADDKAGVAEIMTLAEALLAGEIPHGPISIGFTPDEEIGEGPDFFDVPGFDAEFAYTVDGGTEGEIEFENFNAAGAKFTVTGFNIHPGGAKDTMINAIAVASEIQSLLPEAESPRNTEGYEGFYHLTSMSGDVAHAESEYIIRDHDAEKFAAKEENLRRIEKAMNEKYGEGTVKLEIKEQYRNMAEKIRPCYHLIENAEEAARRAGMEPIVLPIRGGTDGARLSFMGLPCPNIGTGGYACHGPYEHITVEGMEKTMAMLKELVKIYAE